MEMSAEWLDKLFLLGKLLKSIYVLFNIYLLINIINTSVEVEISFYIN